MRFNTAQMGLDKMVGHGGGGSRGGAGVTEAPLHEFAQVGGGEPVRPRRPARRRGRSDGTFQIVDMDMLAGGDRGCGAADCKPVFHDGFARRNVAKRHLVPVGDVTGKSDAAVMALATA